MLLLKSNERYDDILKLNPDTGAIEVGSRKAEPKSATILGHFARLDGGYACLYRWKEKIFFRIRNDVYDIPDGAISLLRDEGNSKSLQILLSDSEICRWTYPKPNIDIIDCLRYTDEEDSDFGVFVNNVINDKERLRRMYR